MVAECDRWNWRELVASEHGPASPTTRHVLLTLSLHMNEHGESCFPSQELLAKRTGLSERAVRTHLDLAEKQGFIAVFQRRRDKKAWFIHEYVATIPAGLDELRKPAPWEEDPKWQRAERPSARSPSQSQRPATGARQAEPDDTTAGTSFHNARKDVPTNSSSNSPCNSTEKRAAEDRNTPFFLNGESEERDSRPSTLNKPHPELQAPMAKEVLQGRVLKNIYTDEELKRKIEKLLAVKADPDTIVRTLVSYASNDRIRRILNHDYGIPWISAP